MARPRKTDEEKKTQGTYRKDRDSAKRSIAANSDKYEVIRQKLKDVEALIKDTPIDGNEKKLIDLSNLYQKFIQILRTPDVEEKAKTMVDALWKN